MELLNALGIDTRILIAQLINFTVLLFVLYKFAYKPLLKFLDERREKIRQGVENARRAEERLEEVKAQEKGIIKNAKKEALGIIEQAKLEAEEKREIMIVRAREEIGEIINSEKEKIRIEKAETLKEIRREVGGLVADALEKVLAESVDKKRDQEIIRKVVKNIK
jgi:F-type H+-transporting ATPase subunit b